MTNAIPSGKNGLIPHLVCSPCADAIEFYKKAFGAKVLNCMNEVEGERIMHAELSIDGNVLFVADDFPEHCGGKSHSPESLGGTPVTIHRYVKDCDAAFRRAEEAGAKVMMPPTDMFWGDRYAAVTDPFGHAWAMATHISDPTPEEMAKGAQAMFANA